MNQWIKVLQWVAFIGAFFIIAGTATVYLGLRATGTAVYTVQSPSMKPALEPGDVVGIRKVNPWDIKEGDVVAYLKDGVPVIHRVVEIRWIGYDVVTNIKKADGSTESAVTYRRPREFVFKGDNNPANDSNVVQQSQIIGKKAVDIPPPFSWAATMLSRDTLIVIGVASVIVYVGWELVEMTGEVRRRRRAAVGS